MSAVDSLSFLRRIERFCPATGVRREGDEWVVQDITAVRAVKEYVCPGCVVPIDVGIPHVVTWHYEGLFGEEAAVRDRRHWHTSCWKMY